MSQQNVCDSNAAVQIDKNKEKVACSKTFNVLITLNSFPIGLDLHFQGYRGGSIPCPCGRLGDDQGVRYGLQGQQIAVPLPTSIKPFYLAPLYE